MDGHKVTQDELKAHHTPEDEYFRKLDRERVAAAELRQQRGEKLVCPKDGNPLQLDRYEGFEVERCTHCGGIWLDRHEAAALHRHEAAQPGVLRTLFGTLMPDSE